MQPGNISCNHVTSSSNMYMYVYQDLTWVSVWCFSKLVLMFSWNNVCILRWTTHTYKCSLHVKSIECTYRLPFFNFSFFFFSVVDPAADSNQVISEITDNLISLRVQGNRNRGRGSSSSHTVSIKLSTFSYHSRTPAKL